MLDHQENPQFYHDTPDTAGEYPLSTFWEDTEEREVEVEEEEHQIEGEDSQAPLQPIQGPDPKSADSNYIPDSENASQSVSITLEQNPFNQEWEEHIESQIDQVFNFPKTP